MSLTMVSLFTCVTAIFSSTPSETTYSQPDTSVADTWRHTCIYFPQECQHDYHYLAYNKTNMSWDCIVEGTAIRLSRGTFLCLLSWSVLLDLLVHTLVCLAWSGFLFVRLGRDLETFARERTTQTRRWTSQHWDAVIVSSLLMDGVMGSKVWGVYIRGLCTNTGLHFA